MDKKYKKQLKDLQLKLEVNEITEDDLLLLLLEAREQRDQYKKLYLSHKKANNEIAERILRIGNYLDKADKLCKIH